LGLIKQADSQFKPNDTNHIFLYFVIHFLPEGLVGLLIAVIFLSAWGSIAAALNALASTTMVDFHCRFTRQPLTEKQKLTWSRGWTLGWGIFCIIVAQFAGELGNSLIEAVNVLGSLFYGVILGIFLIAFYLKKVGATATFWAAVVAEMLVITVYKMDWVAFLWLNVIGCVLVVGMALGLEIGFRKWKS
jgi:solute:Na+ symporter, SSS family